MKKRNKMPKKKEKEITNTELLESINRSFSKIEEKMATKEDLKIQQDVSQIMLKEITAIHEDTKFYRENISTLYTDHLAYDRKIDNINVRVEKLESKTK